MSKEEFKDEFKIIVLGKSGVGKTTIMEQYAKKLFEEKEDWKLKIGVQFFQKSVLVDENNYNLQIWDFIDDKRFEKLHEQYYSGTSAVLFVFDLSKPETFEYHSTCLKKIWHNINLNRWPLLLIGNKFDLIKNPETLDRKKFREFVKKEGLVDYIETSMNDNSNLEKAIVKLIHQIIIRKSIYTKKISSNLRKAIMREYKEDFIPAYKNGKYFKEPREDELKAREEERKKRRKELKKVEEVLRRIHQVKFLVNEKELKEIEIFAKKTNQSKSEFIRSAVRERIMEIKGLPRNQFLKEIKKIISEELKNNILLKKIDEEELKSRRKGENKQDEDLKVELKKINETLERLEKQDR